LVLGSAGMGRRIGWIVCLGAGARKAETGLTCGLALALALALDLALDLVIDPDFAGWRLHTRQLTTEAATRRDTGH